MIGRIFRQLELRICSAYYALIEITLKKRQPSAGERHVHVICHRCLRTFHQEQRTNCLYENCFVSGREYATIGGTWRFSTEGCLFSSDICICVGIDRSFQSFQGMKFLSVLLESEKANLLPICQRIWYFSYERMNKVL